MSISGSATEPNKKRNKLKHSKGNNKKIRFASNGSEVEVFSRRTLSRLPTSHDLEDQWRSPLVESLLRYFFACDENTRPQWTCDEVRKLAVIDKLMDQKIGIFARFQ